MNRESLRQLYEELKNEPANASKAWKQERGRNFQELIRGVLEEQHLEPRGSFRPTGEEVDGAFRFREHFFLLEAKWTATSQPASALYAFMGKVSGKLTGTLGVFISFNGYSDDAVDALLQGKELNMVLFDGRDFEACLGEKRSFSSILDFKLRVAAETGNPFVPHDTEEVLTKEQALTVVGEYPIDAYVLGQFALRLFGVASAATKAKFSSAHGKISAARLADFLAPRLRESERLVFVVDSDGDTRGTEELFHRENSDYELIVVEPELEAWVFQDPATREAQKRELRAMPPEQRKLRLHETIQSIDLAKLRASDSSFDRFAQMFSENARKSE